MKAVTPLIPENVAPIGAKRITVHDSSGNRVGGIPLGHFARPTAEPLYRFCALADVHIQSDTATDDFARALAYADEHCAFTCIAGDLTNQGIHDDYLPYQNIVTAHQKPVYAMAGNHEHYSVRDPNWLLNATGKPLYYSFAYGDDVFIMVGHFGGYDDSIGNWRVNDFVSTEELKWLYETLEDNYNKRCFVFIHVLPIAHGVGDPCGLYTKRNPAVSGLWDVRDGVGKAVIDLLRHYKNTILFHGHSHTMLGLQEDDPKANYSDVDGYRSVHIPSLAVPRDEVNSALKDFSAESEGYIVDVYDGYIILNGRDFIGGDGDGHWIPLGTYRIDTPLQNVEAGTFEDSTGLITT